MMISYETDLCPVFRFILVFNQISGAVIEVNRFKSNEFNLKKYVNASTYKFLTHIPRQCCFYYRVLKKTIQSN